jgi:uncharacterized protein
LLDTFLGFSISWPRVWVFSLMLFALVSSLFPAKRLALLLLISSTFGAWWYDLVQLIGIANLVLLLVSASQFNRAKNNIAKFSIASLVFVIAVLLILHLLPGFNNPKVIDAMIVSQNAVPFSKYLNFDKLVLAVVLLLFVVPKSHHINIRTLFSIVSVFLLVSMACFTLAVMTNVVAFEAKLPAITGGWLLTNLFLTCFAEETFFRGFIQVQLQKISPHIYWRTSVVALSGLIFGLAHLPAGLIYALIATLMGCCYAYAYHRSKNILIPITLHFSFNCLHFFLFTYPYLST